MTNQDDDRLSPHVKTLGLAPSFGFGDRTGLATAGHVAAMRQAGQGIRPIFPQQSIREMARTGRTAHQVMQDALQGMQAAGWSGTTGADADHLKTIEDIDVTFHAGFCFFTLDPSDAVDTQADDYAESSLPEKVAGLDERVDWIDRYRGRQVTLPNGTRLTFDLAACQRAAVKYGMAIVRVVELADHLATLHDKADRPYEIELSVDETPQPTTLVEHFIVAEQCLEHQLPLVSLAPRFPGDFEKGVDYKGDAQQLDQSLDDHAAIARLLGPYKLSLHSGSDKISMYTAFARATRGLFHVKTAGTSYLEALRVVSRHDDSLFREIIDFSRRHFETDKATYHLSACLADVPAGRDVAMSSELESIYLERWSDVSPGCGFTAPGRQILHCTFGSVLTHPQLGESLRQVLRSHPQTYAEVLQDHFARHLDALQAGLH